ncbi:[protein release factor]-glutamine N5-methyltransferase [Granulicella rosea]|uniref:Release factor glutamine methyltransferase n=1 Tax=Granulicella rosea TaxID=474952 RepID=A0A239D5E9_9BACT|nr:peptide chain release factor N(5)-glutamine methyltransferase [Granulicella rosea]SNS27054.1 [protein release factor]-glutamine N5-methyltransferase [Granulicella rosea]
MITVEEALRRGVSQLSARPELRETALQDAALLLMHTLGVTRATLVAHPERRFTTEEQVAYQAMLQRRVVFEPLQYILGEQEFYGLPLKVTPAVLIPRPETEHLVEAVLARLPKDKPVRIADIGTGSGAIAIALAHLLPLAEVAALDLSPAALSIARENAIRHGVQDRIRFIESDLLAAVAGERFDAIVSNPPYIPSADRETMHPQVTEFEPAGALFAEDDGLAVYQRLIPQAAQSLEPSGLLAMEFGFGQRDAIAELLSGWDAVGFIDDLQGIPRVALARWP